MYVRTRRGEIVIFYLFIFFAACTTRNKVSVVVFACFKLIFTVEKNFEGGMGVGVC